MQTAQVHIKGKQIGNELAKVEQLGPQLVMLFASHGLFEAGGMVEQVCKRFPKALVIGCSTAGEISNNGVFDDSLVVTGVHFDSQVQLKPITATVSNMEGTLSAGTALGKQLTKKDLKAVFVLSRGLDVNGSALIEGLRHELGQEVTITGGLAGDGGQFKKTWTVINGKASTTDVVGFGVYGTAIQVAFGSMGGWEPYGPVRKVTKAKHNVLFELDGEPALDIYKKYLGNKAKDLPGVGLLYPFAILKDNQDSTGLIRTILAVDEAAKSVTLAGDIEEGGIVRLMHANNSGLTSGAKGAAETTSKGVRTKQENGLAILISCVGRKLVMGADVEDELDAVKEEFGKHCEVTGFYSYGEICPTGFGECKLHNQTMTITYLYEAA